MSANGLVQSPIGSDYFQLNVAIRAERHFEGLAVLHCVFLLDQLRPEHPADRERLYDATNKLQCPGTWCCRGSRLQPTREIKRWMRLAVGYNGMVFMGRIEEQK
jgi:hypothetical protein